MAAKSIFEQLRKPYIVVVLDDEEGVADVIVMYLEDHFSDTVSIKTFTDAEKAFEYMKAEKPHLLITDVRMPKISGDSLVGYALEIFRNMQILVMTGDASLTIKTNCYLDGAQGMLLKPLDKDQIIEMVQLCINYFSRWEKTILSKK